MPTFKLVDESGTWLSDILSGVPDWKRGDRIVRGRDDTLEVVEVRDGDDKLGAGRPSWTSVERRVAVGWPGHGPLVPRVPATSRELSSGRSRCRRLLLLTQRRGVLGSATLRTTHEDAMSAPIGSAAGDAF